MSVLTAYLGNCLLEGGGIELATVKKGGNTLLMGNSEAVWLSISVTDDSTSHQYSEQNQH